VEKNIPEQLWDNVTIDGHEWGVLDTDFARSHKEQFSRIIAADCYWMPWQHENLVKSMLHFLSTDPAARIFAVGGFHTGRAKLAAFFDVAEENGLEVEEIYEEDEDGVRREWAKEKDGGRENVTERKKWLMISRLRRRDSPEEQ
jgi:nicotinamide N-methyltransferase